MVITNTVRCVFQTYVESLKVDDKFDVQSQENALTKARDITLSQLSEDAKEYIKNNFGNINDWINTQIEESIIVLKNI